MMIDANHAIEVKSAEWTNMVRVHEAVINLTYRLNLNLCAEYGKL